MCRESFFDAGKPVAAICHGPWTVIEAGAAGGRKIASWPSLKTDLRNAGAEGVDKEAVVDDDLVSARRPDGLPAFNRAMIETFAHRARAQGGKPALAASHSDFTGRNTWRDMDKAQKNPSAGQCAAGGTERCGQEKAARAAK